MCVQVGEDKEVGIVKGDITKENKQMSLAHLTNPDLILKGDVATALAWAGGQDIERECQDNVNLLKQPNANNNPNNRGKIGCQSILLIWSPLTILVLMRLKNA